MRRENNRIFFKKNQKSGKMQDRRGLYRYASYQLEILNEKYI